MLSNVYSKQEILDELAKKGYFIDAYTLDTFFEQWKIEAIYEDEESKEFFDKNTLDVILNNLFKKEKEDEEMSEEEKSPIENQEDKIEQESKEDEIPAIEDENEQEKEEDLKEEETNKEDSQEKDEELKLQKDEDEALKEEVKEEPQEEDFDDMSLISDSFEAQEQFRQYVVSQLSKNNVDLTPRNEFKLDISERTLNMIAKTLAKKITKYVGAICAADAKVQVQLEEAQAKNQKLEDRVESLEEQNRKLRMLLTESNKNLNSYKPGLFGFYVKVPPKR